MNTDNLSGKNIVIKLSGKVIDNNQILYGLLQELCEIRKKGARVWIVHGGGKQIDKELKANGIEPRFINGLRVTDQKTLEVVKTVLNSVRKKVIDDLIAIDIKANICKVSDYIFLSKIKSEVYGLVGEPVAIDKIAISQCLQYDIIVLSSIGKEVASSVLLNINSDEAAVEVAKFIKADKLVFVSDVPGVLMNPNDMTSVIKKINTQMVEEMIANGKIRNGMIPKVHSCAEAAKTIGSICILNEETGILKGLKEEGGTTIVL